jgi:hypothetical protein
MKEIKSLSHDTDKNTEVKDKIGDIESRQYYVSISGTIEVLPKSRSRLSDITGYNSEVMREFSSDD